MDRELSIFFAASEISGYASTGGLGDVVSALPEALSVRPGLRVQRVMPMYRQVLESAHNLKDTGMRLDLPMGPRKQRAEVWTDADSEVTTWFIRRDEYFDRRELYSLPERDYDDNFERFNFFQKAVVELIDTLGKPVDIVHCNDWQTGLIPLYLRKGVYGAGRGATERSVFTIHNLAFQGLFPGLEYYLTNLPLSMFTVDHVEFYGKLNSMKGGIVDSDLVTTVSKTYAEEIQTPELGCGLQGVLAQLGDRLVGIVNGVDYTHWDPSTDHLIAKKYSAANLDGKKMCRQELLQEMGLKDRPGAPLIGMVTRMVDQKGLDILAEAIPALMETDVLFVLLGSGQEEYHRLATRWAKAWPDTCGVRLGFDIDLAHRIEAGSDIFLMPSRYEPCGLNQLYSLRYGTLPVVHRTGGLADTVEDSTLTGSHGTGFLFDEYSAEALLGAVRRATQAFAKPTGWRRIMRRGMGRDYSWDRAADAYHEVYRRLTPQPRVR